MTEEHPKRGKFVLFFQTFAVTFAMYSAIPMPHVVWNKDNMRYTNFFFPLVGAVVGGLFLLWYRLSLLAGFTGVLFAVIATAISPLVTGCLHLDGFCDTTDSLFSSRPREEKLKIMKDPHAGTFAVIGAVLLLLLRFGALYEVYAVQSDRAVYILALTPVLARIYSGYSVARFPKARKDGLVVAFGSPSGPATGPVLIVFAGIVSLLMILVSPAPGLVTSLLVLLSFLGYKRMSMRVYGGITGDLAGFFLETAEAAGLLGLALFSGLMVTGGIL